MRWVDVSWHDYDLTNEERDDIYHRMLVLRVPPPKWFSDRCVFKNGRWLYD